MGDGITKLFDRSYIVGFFAPALYLTVIFILVLNFFGHSLPCVTITADDPLRNATLITGFSVAVSIFLMSLNREIFRAAEGYWPRWIQERLLKWQLNRSVERFTSVQGQVEALRAQKAKQGKAFAEEKQLSVKWREFVTDFPDQEEFVLPTRFGNTVRAFEVYSRVMYGVDSIPAWPRLQGVVSREFMDLVTESRARVNFWLNIWAVTVLLLLEWIILECCSPALRTVWLPVVYVPILIFSLHRATSSAKQYGEYVKAAFDLYLPKLGKKITSYDVPPGTKSEDFWTAYSQALVFLHKGRMSDAHEMAKQLSTEKYGTKEKPIEKVPWPGIGIK